MVYFVGNALTQLVSLMLLKIITANISSEEYGTYDLVVTIGNLVLPVATFQISDALFRFFLRAQTEAEKKECFTASIVVLIGSIFLTGVGVYLVHALITDLVHPVLITLYLISRIVQDLYQRIARSMGKSKVYVAGNLLNTVFFLVLKFVFIFVFGMGVEALFLAAVISSACFFVFAELNIQSVRYFDLRWFRWFTLKKMLRYSFPLVPNAAFWWLTSSVNTLIVSARLGLDLNGIYAIANKFAQVLTLVTSVFAMSWQESAISEHGKKGYQVFYTNTLNMYSVLVFSAVAAMIPLVRLLLPVMVDESYHASIQYAPFLLAGSGLSALYGFLAQVFCANGKTQWCLWTSFVGLVINISIVFLLVNSAGLWAAVIGSFGASLAMVATRYFGVRKEFAKGIGIWKLMFAVFLILIGIYCYFKADQPVNLVWFLIQSVIVLILNRALIQDILGVLLQKLGKG